MKQPIIDRWGAFVNEPAIDTKYGSVKIRTYVYDSRLETRVSVYQNTRGRWRWKAYNCYEILEVSAHSYAHRTSCVRDLKRHGYKVNQIEKG